MTEIPAELIAAATRAGMIDHDDLRILDIAKLPRNPNGWVLDARGVVEGLRRDHPAMFQAAKHARDLTPEERAVTIQDASRTPATGSLPHAGKRASDMTLDEQHEFIRAYRSKFPDAAQSMSAPRKSPYRI